MSKIMHLIKNNEEKIRNSVISMLLVLSTVFIGKVVTENIFIWSKLYNWFGFESINIQMGFCLHTTIIIFIFSTLFCAFIVDRLLMKNRFPLLSRRLFWILLLIIIISVVIGHYRTINAMGIYEEAVFDKFKYLICY